MRTLIFVPTYNEADNVLALYQEIERLGLGCDFLFLDDNSPDGTGEIIDRIARENPRFHALHRTGKLGIGSAHIDGIRWAYNQGYEALLTMDCDFTHSPGYIPQFLERIAGSHIVVGSRFLHKDSLPGWTALRKTLTHVGHFMTKFLLGMPLDSTGAFRVYRLDSIPVEIFDLMESRGYSFFFESLYVFWFNGTTIHEIPISLPARSQGQSKMRVGDAVQSLRMLIEVLTRRILRPGTLRFSGRLPTVGQAATSAQDHLETGHSA